MSTPVSDGGVPHRQRLPQLNEFRRRLYAVAPGSPEDVGILEEMLVLLKPGIWTHAKRGTRYRVKQMSRLQVEGPDDLFIAVSYQDVDTGAWWTRTLSYFLDPGRFLWAADDASGNATANASREASRQEGGNPAAPADGDA